MMPDNLYARLRASAGVVVALREDRDAPPPERLLQAVWQHQRLVRDRLQTLDGQPVRVLHPGFRNVEAGPDFSRALVQIGDAPPRTGDVEVDVRPDAWQAHGHAHNPAFENVILHVVWEAGRRTASPIPTLPLAGRLDAPLAELNQWLGSEGSQSLPERWRGQCCAPLRALGEQSRRELLRQAALVRLQCRAAQFEARARQAGWEQALWEGLFRALGYKHNTWPMHWLAEHRPRWQPSRDDFTLVVQARLLGMANLLPAELPRRSRDHAEFCRHLWDVWWRERETFHDLVLPRAAWRFSGLRPANHPQRRLALAAHWVVWGDLPRRLDRWVATSQTAARAAAALSRLLQVADDPFWCWHWNLRSARLPKPQPLLGAARVTDLGVNVILPWLWVRAAEGQNATLQTAITQWYFDWPAGQDNALLRQARQRLLGDAPRSALRTAAEQQGMLQILRDFCAASNALCERCGLPEILRQWPA